MKTYIYIDGFNFYYLALRNTKFKWLDFKALFDGLLPKNNIIKIKYFTANVSATYDKQQPIRQEAYFRALRKTTPEIEIIKGYFQTHKVKMPLASDPTKRIEVLKTEEKCTDVNLAVHLINDGWKKEYECAVIVSNDGDMAEAMRIVNEELMLPIGLAVPGKTTISNSLLKYATFIKRIRKRILTTSQLPDKIPNTNIFKPKEW